MDTFSKYELSFYSFFNICKCIMTLRIYYNRAFLYVSQNLMLHNVAIAIIEKNRNDKSTVKKFQLDQSKV